MYGVGDLDVTWPCEFVAVFIHIHSIIVFFI